MPATADNLRDLHVLHQRAMALRDRLATGPKALAARLAALAKRQAEADAARNDLKHLRADQKNREVQVQGIRTKTDDLRVKLNAIKKQAEYDALRNQIAQDNLAASKLEDEILEMMGKIESGEVALRAMDAEVAKAVAEAAAIRADLDAKAEGHRAQLVEIEAAIGGAEDIIPEDQRDQYRRVVKQRQADAMAAVEGGACTGCYVAVTHQMINELMLFDHLIFCKTCGRALYLTEEERPARRRKSG